MVKKHTHVWYITIIALLLITSFYFYSTTTKELATTSEKLSSVETQSEEMKEFFKTYAEATTLIDNAFASIKVAENNYGIANNYYETRTAFYEAYTSIVWEDIYDYDGHVDLIDLAIGNSKDAQRDIAKAKNRLEKLKGKEDDFRTSSISSKHYSYRPCGWKVIPIRIRATRSDS